MPCYEPPMSDREIASRNQRDSEDRIIRELSKAKGSNLEPLLCSACRVLTRLGYDFDENPALSIWWDNHKKEDAKKEKSKKALRKKNYK